jgi:hypothetical protein
MIGQVGLAARAGGVHRYQRFAAQCLLSYQMRCAIPTTCQLLRDCSFAPDRSFSLKQGGHSRDKYGSRDLCIRIRSATPDDLSDDVSATTLAAGPIGTWKPDLIERRRWPWFRTKAAAAALAAVALTAIVMAGVLLLSRGTEQATSAPPQATATTSRSPSGAPPAPSQVPSAAPSTPPAPPPPPSSTTARTVSPPPVVRNQESWSYSPPSPTKKPELGVTRAPIRSAPPSPPKSGTNSATPDGKPKPWGGLFG